MQESAQSQCRHGLATDGCALNHFSQSNAGAEQVTRAMLNVKRLMGDRPMGRHPVDSVKEFTDAEKRLDKVEKRVRRASVP